MEKQKGTLIIKNPTGNVAYSITAQPVPSGITVIVTYANANTMDVWTNWNGSTPLSTLINTTPTTSVQQGTPYTFTSTTGYFAIANYNRSGSGTRVSSITGDITLKGSYDSIKGYSGTTGTINVESLCLVEGTPVLLANGLIKPVEKISYDDIAICYDFYNGQQTQARIDWIMKPGVSESYWKIILSDRTELKLVGSNGKSHRLYNVTKQSFMYPQDFEKNDLTLKSDGSFVNIVSCEEIKEKVKYYNIATKDHINLYANGVLTSNRLSNKYRIVDNKYTDEQLMSDEDVEKYLEHLKATKL